MKAERWRQIREVFERAVAFNGMERSGFLDQACSADPELRREVESLLLYEGRTDTGFLNIPAVALLETVPAAPLGNRAGRRLGVYQILEEIGHGGMGEVYRACRVDGQYEQQVAVKMVRGGYDTRLILERFRHERQILATLDHPNIARLLDGGTSEDGIPYLVMELIEGEPIDQFCEKHKLSISERLTLFLQVCAAVQYAHGHLVVHRDIKPGNILVTGTGVPKLLDFGIAKILGLAAGSQTTLVNPLTPEYASPEQILGEAITTATDVYSLGVVLYQLLTGQSPYGSAPRSPTELLRAITEMEPARPSLIVQRAERMSTDSAGALGQPSTAKLSRRLRGDLDTIALKALRKEPRHRYASVEQLAEDIRREIEGLPVAARKGSWAYRALKFLRRNRIGVTAAALLGLAIVAGVAATIRESRIAAANERRAERRFNDVRQLANSLIFEIHDSIQSLPGATPSRKLLLDRAVQYLDKLSQDASGDVDLQRELAWAYERLATVQGDTTQSNLGHVSAAEESHRKATALFETIARANPHNVSDQLNVAAAYRMGAFFDIFVPTGREKIDRALAASDPLMRTNGDNLEVKNERAEEYLILAFIQDATGDRLQAIDTYRNVLRLRRDILQANPDYPGIRQKAAKTSIYLGHQIARFGSYDEAMPLMNRGIAEYETLVKSNGDPGLIRDLSASFGRRGDAELIQGNFAAAYSDFRRSKEMIVHLAKLDPENQMLQSDLWVDEFQEGRALAASGRDAEALPVLLRAFEGYKNLHLEDDVGPGPGAMKAWIGEAQAGTHDFAGAIKHYRDAAEDLDKDQSSYDDARCDLAMVETKIGNALAKTGRRQEAAAEYAKALQTSNVSFSVEHMDIPALYAAADAYAGMGDLAVMEARRTRDTAAQARLVKQARASYENSLRTWRQIPYPSRISGNGYAALSGPKQITARLAALTP